MDPRSHDDPGPVSPYRSAVTPLYGAAAWQDPGALYEHLRRHWGPVAPVEIAPGVPAWLVLGHREVLDVIWNAQDFSSDPRRWRAAAHGPLPDAAPLLALLGPRPVASRLDGDEHLRHRHALSAALRQIDPRRLGRLARLRAAALVDTWSAEGSADLMTAYARPLVWDVLTRLLGLSQDSVSTLDALTRTVMHGSPDAAHAEEELLRAMRRLVTERSVAPGPDLSSWLAQAGRLTDDEIAHNLVALVLIGAESTASWIGNAIRSLFRHEGPVPAAADGNLVPYAVEHALRAGAPMPNIAGRWATVDVTLAGYRISAGDLVVPSLAAANADLGLRSTSLSRTRAHLAWGTGAHGCPAKDEARMIVETAVEVLVNRIPDLHPARADVALRRRPSPWCGAPAELPVVFSPSAEADHGHERAARPDGPTLMNTPEKTRSDPVVREAPPQRWNWWHSLGGW